MKASIKFQKKAEGFFDLPAVLRDPTCLLGRSGDEGRGHRTDPVPLDEDGSWVVSALEGSDSVLEEMALKDAEQD